MLQDIDESAQRYADIIKIYKAGKSAKVDANWKLDEVYVEDFITHTGADWNFDQHKTIDTKPVFDDFRKTVSDYLAWEVEQLLKRDGNIRKVNSCSLQSQLERLEKDYGIEWQENAIKDLFEIGTGSLVDIKSAKTGKIPRVSVQTTDNGIIGYFDESIENARYFENFVSVNFFGISYYHPYYASVEMKVHTLKLKHGDFTQAVGLFISAVLNSRFDGLFSYGNQLSSSKLKDDGIKIRLPMIAKSGKLQVAFDFIEKYIIMLKAERLAMLEAYLMAVP